MMSDALFGPFLATATLHLTPCHIHCRLEHIFTILHQLVLIKHKRKKHLLLAQTMLDKLFGPFFRHCHPPHCVFCILESIYAEIFCQYKIRKEKKNLLCQTTRLLLFRPVGVVCNGGHILVLAAAFDSWQWWSVRKGRQSTLKTIEHKHQHRITCQRCHHGRCQKVQHYLYTPYKNKPYKQDS